MMLLRLPDTDVLSWRNDGLRTIARSWSLVEIAFDVFFLSGNDVGRVGIVQGRIERTWLMWNCEICRLSVGGSRQRGWL
jgi:hypothetical protein